MKYYITLANGDKVPFDGTGLLVNAEDITVDKTLTVDQECKTCNGTGVRTCVD